MKNLQTVAAVARDDAISGDLLGLHAKIGALVYDQPIQLPERPWIEKTIDTFPGGQFAAIVLLLDGGSPAPLHCSRIQFR